jgi:hypothetical protein
MAQNYSTLNHYSTATNYDGTNATSGPFAPTAGWLAVLNNLAGTSGLGELAAANAYAGTTNLGLLAALNSKAGTSNLGLNAVCNSIAGTTGLEALDAICQKTGL